MPAWSEEELAKLNARDIEIGGKLYTRYEVNQMQRALEREVRKQKRRFLAEDAAGLDTTDAAVRLREARRRLADFTREAGNRADSSRTSVSGFGRSEAGRATALAKQAESAFTASSDSAILDSSQEDGSVRKIEATVLGNVDTSSLTPVFGNLQTTEVIVTNERIQHIKERHPNDFQLFQQYGASAISAPDLLIQDSKNTGTVFVVKKLPETNLNVILRLALDTDHPGYKNSVMTFYRIRQKNLEKLLQKNPLLYTRE